MKNIFVLLFTLLLEYSCYHVDPKSTGEFISSPQAQTTLFQLLGSVDTNLTLMMRQRHKFALLVLPIQAACPSCRNKIIDSIIKYKQNLSDDRLILISAKGGKKTINPFFTERGSLMPIENKIVIDSTNKGFDKELFYDKPVIYLVQNNRVYKKVSIIPATIQKELAWFFQPSY